MDKIEALALAQSAIGFLLSESILPGQFLQADLIQAQAELGAIAAELDPARKKAISDTLTALDARRRGEISDDWKEFFNRLDRRKSG